MKTITLPVFGIVLHVNEQGSGSISSDGLCDDDSGESHTLPALHDRVGHSLGRSVAAQNALRRAEPDPAFIIRVPGGPASPRRKRR